jgi:uncharacterized membrane protein HdeD (DUF308 family)
VPEEPAAERRQQRHKRWGLRTLGFLAIALACVLASTYVDGNYTLILDLGVLIGFVGAAYCSYRGLKQSTWLPR